MAHNAIILQQLNMFPEQPGRSEDVAQVEAAVAAQNYRAAACKVNVSRIFRGFRKGAPVTGGVGCGRYAFTP